MKTSRFSETQILRILKQASAALLASLLHDGVLTVEQIKTDLLLRGLPLRPLEPALADGRSLH